MQSRGLVRARLRFRSRSRRALDERLYVALPGVYRLGAALTFRLPHLSRLRGSLLRRSAALAYQGQGRGDWGLTATQYGPDCEVRNVVTGGGRPVGAEETYWGREGVLRFLREWNEPWEALHYEPSEMIDAGDGGIVVLSQLVTRGRESGIEVREQIAQLMELDRGLIVRQRNLVGGGSWDEALRELGLAE